jgi:uncharacterized membrane protein YdjX (TVP38/TMEM64 family)
LRILFARIKQTPSNIQLCQLLIMRAPSRLALVIAVTLLIPIVPFVIVGELPGERWLSAQDTSAVWFGMAGAGLLASDVLLPIPSSIIGTLLGARLGFLSGWFWCWTGLVAGNLIGYLAGRLLFSRFNVHLPQAPTLLVLFVSRPVPVLAEAVTIAAGAGKMRFAQFAFVCVISNGMLAGALAGNGAAYLPDDVTGPGLALPMLLPVIAWLIWQHMVRRQKVSANSSTDIRSR